MAPIVFELTEAEAGAAAARWAWRRSLEGGLLLPHLAPLATFVLALLFVAILGWSGLVSRRAAEIALIGSAAAYMSYRLWTRRRFLAARRAALAWAEEGRRAGPATLTSDETGFRLAARGIDRRWRFDERLRVETVADLVYVWPRFRAPLVWPRRAHADETAEAAFLAFAVSATAPPANR